jgi:hypothetical protein
MLSHRKDYVRRFAGETLAFLLRKVRVRDALKVYQVGCSFAFSFFVFVFVFCFNCLI